MNINLGEKYQQIKCTRCGLNWIVAKGQRIGMDAAGYTLPALQQKAERSKTMQKNKILTAAAIACILAGFGLVRAKSAGQP